MDKERAIRRIKHLLQVHVRNNSSQNEMEVAARLIKGLLKKHDLTLFDVERKQFEEEIVDMEHKFCYTTYPYWIRNLASHIALALECKAIFSVWADYEYKYGTYRKTSVHFIGHRTDAEVAAYFFEVLERELWRLGGEHAEAAGIRGSEKAIYRKNFIVGATAAIYERLKKEIPQGEGTGKDLMVVKAQAVAKRFEELYPQHEKMNPSSLTSDWGAMGDGEKVGKSMLLKPGVKASYVREQITQG